MLWALACGLFNVPICHCRLLGHGPASSLQWGSAKLAHCGCLAGTESFHWRFPWLSIMPEPVPSPSTLCVCARGVSSTTVENASHCGFQPPGARSCTPLLREAFGLAVPRAVLRSMLQPLLTPRRDRWTRQGIACTGGTLIPVPGLCLQLLTLTLPMPWQPPDSWAVPALWHPSLWPLGTAAVLHP